MILPTISINSYKKLVQKECIPDIEIGQRRQFLFGLDTLASSDPSTLVLRLDGYRLVVPDGSGISGSVPERY